LQRALGNVEQANVKADNIMLELHDQEQKIGRIHNDVQDTKTQLKRAREYIKYFAKQVYTDKILMCLICLCIIAVIVIIGLKIFKDEGVKIDPDVFKKS